MTLPFFMPETASAILMIEAIRKRGLLTNLQLCLDARDKDSYTSGQSWLDRSGNGFDFFRGADVGATATDPTFNGTAGMPSGYFSFDGGDYFTYDTTNETWMQNLHKDSAAFTLAGWIFPQSGTFYVFGTFPAATASASIGAGMYIVTGTSNLGLVVANNTVPLAFSLGANVGITTGVWQFVAIRVDEAANTMSIVCNDTVSTNACTYTSPSASNATSTATLAASGGGGSPFPNTARMGAFAAWSRALSLAEISSLRNEMRPGFGV